MKGKCFKTTRCLSFARSTVAVSKWECLSEFDATLFDRAVFLILRRVCFRALKKVGLDMILCFWVRQGQVSPSGPEKKTSHVWTTSVNAIYLHIYTPKHQNVLGEVEKAGQSHADLRPGAHLNRIIGGARRALRGPSLSLQCE